MTDKNKCCEKSFLKPLCDAFLKMYGDKRGDFCDPPDTDLAVHDGNKGVQWYAGYFKKLESSLWIPYAGVNLEGLKYETDKEWRGYQTYDGRPLLCLIDAERARSRGKLLDAIDASERIAGIAVTSKIRVYVDVEMWAGGESHPTRQHELTDHILDEPLNDMKGKENYWRGIMQEAYRRKDWHLKLRPEYDRSETRILPHLYFRYILPQAPQTKDEWIDTVEGCKVRMKPIYDFVTNNMR